MTVYLVRHGQSEANARRAHSGQGSSPLTEQGFRDAEKAGKRLAGIRFDRVFSSDQLRARQTACRALPGIEPELDQRLREIDVGSLVERLVTECEAEYGPKYLEDKKTRDYTSYGGENDQMQYDRCADFLRMLEGLEGCENAAVFSHGGAIRCMLSYVLGTRLTLANSIFQNGSVTVLRWKDGVWSLLME